MKTLVEQLKEYNSSDYYGFHMPGHKRNLDLLGEQLPYGIDITEIEGFDDLHHPEGVLLEGQKRAAKAFEAEESFYLINGSTAGNLSAVLSVTDVGDKILMARNNHKSVYNGVFLNHLKPVYVYPEYDEVNGIMGVICKENVKDALEKDGNIKAVVIVSPTYDGVISDIRGIAEVAHAFGVPLIVDEAHGAHLGMHEYFPANSNKLGADIVIHSVHKTLPSLTQTGLLHVNGNLVDRDKLRRYLKMLQSSSPSYVLMSSIDACVHLIDAKREELFDAYVEVLNNGRQRLDGLQLLELIETKTYDKSKIVISTRKCECYKDGMTSKQLYSRLLEKYHLQLEMCGANYVTAMTSVADTLDGMNRLVEALLEIDMELVDNYKGQDRNVLVKEYKEMLAFPQLLQAEEGETGSQWFYYVYPPGIPFVVPGEVITEEAETFIKELEEAGFTIHKG